MAVRSVQGWGLYFSKPGKKRGSAKGRASETWSAGTGLGRQRDWGRHQKGQRKKHVVEEEST